MKKNLFIVTLFSAVIFSGCTTGNQEPKQVLGDFLAALSKRDMETARKNATKESGPMLDLVEIGMNMTKKNTKLEIFNGDKDSIEIGQAKIDGDNATVPVKEVPTGKSVDFHMKKEGGGWKVALDKASFMGMGNEMMNKEGINPSDSVAIILDKFKNMDIDSLKAVMKGRIQLLDSANEATKR